MPKTYLISSIAGLALTLNAIRPFPGVAFMLPGFFASWLTDELAPQLLLIHVIVNAWLISGGAVHGATGWTALGLSILVAGGLAFMVRRALRDEAVFAAALREGGIDDSQPAGVPWRVLANPFWFRHSAVKRIRNLAYADGGGRRHRLDIYRPRDDVKDAPVLLQIHGGGWVVSNKDQQGKPVMLHMASRGWVCVAINYRLSPRAAFPDHLIDCKRALAWVRSNIARFGGDPSFVMVTGGSAGGHLTALMGLTANDPEYQPGFEDADTSVQAAVPMYGVYDFTNDDRSKPAVKYRIPTLERMVMKRPFSDREAYEKASPHYRIHADAPPFMVVHGGNDSLTSIAETRRFVESLRATSRTPVVYAELPNAQHAFDVFHSIRTVHAVRAIERFGAWVRSRSASVPANHTIR